jgi:hypothetical protein
MFSRYVCVFISPDFDGNRAPKMKAGGRVLGVGMIHDMFVYKSGLGRVQGTKNVSRETSMFVMFDDANSRNVCSLPVVRT